MDFELVEPDAFGEPFGRADDGVPPAGVVVFFFAGAFFVAFFAGVFVAALVDVVAPLVADASVAGARSAFSAPAPVKDS